MPKSNQETAGRLNPAQARKYPKDPNHVCVGLVVLWSDYAVVCKGHWKGRDCSRCITRLLIRRRQVTARCDHLFPDLTTHFKAMRQEQGVTRCIHDIGHPYAHATAHVHVKPFDDMQDVIIHRNVRQ